MLDITIKIGSKGKNTGMMGMDLEDMMADMPVIKKKKRKRKSMLQKAVESSIQPKPKYETEIA